MRPYHVQTPATSLNDQTKLVAALGGQDLRHAAKYGAALIETHISWVWLIGEFAYKIKKAVKLDFLDFTDIEQRRFYCHEEIRLNRRLAPDIYLDVVPIGGTADSPEWGRLPALEWAVRMTRFDVRDEMDSRLRSGTLFARHIDTLAVLLARFHQSLTPSPPETAYGNADRVYDNAMRNLIEMAPLLADLEDKLAFADLVRVTEAEGRARRACFERRRREGFVRECHGDLHLANIVIINDTPTPFDCIEFDPSLRWIDVMDDLAFAYMDLIRYGWPDYASRLLTGYLEEAGDYAGLEVLPFYASCRAAVRAKVCALRAAQTAIGANEKTALLAACRAYLETANALMQRRTPVLIITSGLPGSGKSTFALAAVERLSAIRIRSDVERKRLFGLKPLEGSKERVGNIYGADAGMLTYEALRRIAGMVLSAGFSVIVDAAFLRQSERESFRQLAESLDVPFAVASLQSRDETLRQRIADRMRQGGDPSEADLDVLAFLQGVAEPLQATERTRAVDFINDRANGFPSDDPAWGQLKSLLNR